jgi:polysaccharide biosynthesis/export protein
MILNCHYISLTGLDRFHMHNIRVNYLNSNQKNYILPMLYLFKYRLPLALILGIASQLFSCTTAKKVVYAYDLKDTTAGSLRKAQSTFENPIQKNDQLSISIGSSNPPDLIILNSANGIVGGLTNVPISTGYLVEADGKIQLPFLGKVQAEGLTRLQLEDVLTERFKDYTKNPVVNVRFLNYNFSVLGEVAHPGKFNMATERTTILEALGMAGDVNDLGKRENVLVIREENGQRDFARVNLLSKDLFLSPYYYLKTNDVVYVEPVRAKFITRTGVPQYLGVAAVGISLLITILNVTKAHL